MSARGWGSSSSRGRSGRGGGGSSRGGGSSSSAPEDLSPTGLLRSADELAARAARRGTAATPQEHAAASAKYEQAAAAAAAASTTTTTTSSSLLVRALLGLGESRQREAEATVEAAKKSGGVGPAPRDAERSAVEAALALLASAATACDQALSRATGVDDDDARAMREDAAANGARALCAAAGLMMTAAGEAALPLLDRAVALYEGLLPSSSAPDDGVIPPVETLTDLADALMQRAEARASSGAAAAEAASAAAVEGDVSRALDLYARACGACDSSQGDDLPGLLHNWGVGLFTASRLAAAAAASGATTAAEGEEAVLRLLGEAAGKLRASAAFARGDPQPHNALGDVLVALAERASGARSADEAAAVAAAAATGLAQGGAGDNDNNNSLLGRAADATRADLASPAAQGSPQALARALLRAAVAEGYGGALTLSRRDADGLVGCAEVAVLLGKASAAATAGEYAAAALGHFAEGARLYAQALRDAAPGALGSADERAEVAFNGVCALALAGDAAGAVAALRALRPAVSPDEVRAEPDLRAVWSQPGWEEAVFGDGGASG